MGFRIWIGFYLYLCKETHPFLSFGREHPVKYVV